MYRDPMVMYYTEQICRRGLDHSNRKRIGKRGCDRDSIKTELAKHRATTESCTVDLQGIEVFSKTRLQDT